MNPRLIGRSLRMMLDLSQLGERTIRIDCDVLNADGGTRTAAITGAALAVRDAVIKLQESGQLEEMPAILPLAAVSAGIVGGVPLLDLDYQEDSRAEADANFIMTGGGAGSRPRARRKANAPRRIRPAGRSGGKGHQGLLGLWRLEE
jgi:ribonuclease PH